MGVDHLSLRFTIRELLKGYTFGVTSDLSAHSSVRGDMVWTERINGFVHRSHVWMLSPVTERAFMHLLMDEGLDAQPTGTRLNISAKNGWTETRVRVQFLRDLIRRSIGKGKRINASHRIRIDNTFIGLDHLNVMLRNYTKKNDTLTIKTATGMDNYPVRFVSPCGDWEMTIAPQVDPNADIEGIETVARLTTTNNEATKEDQQ